MAFKHGKSTFVSVAGNDLSPFTNTSNLNRSADSHDVTTYGKDAHVFDDGLTNSTFSMGGIYDDQATGPGDVLKPLIGQGAVALIRRCEGTGSGLPQETVDVIITSYVETNPVADMVTWSCEFQGSDDIADTNQ